MYSLTRLQCGYVRSLAVKCFFPDGQISRFLLSDDVGILITELVAMGSPAVGTMSFGQSAARVPSISSLPNEPSTSGLQTQPLRKNQTSSVKIIQASMKRLANGKAEFAPQNKTFVDLCEATANVNYVTSVVQQKWGSDHLLVTSDGLQLDDSSGTQGEH